MPPTMPKVGSLRVPDDFLMDRLPSRRLVVWQYSIMDLLQSFIGALLGLCSGWD